jgi:hypothetical protein
VVAEIADGDQVDELVWAGVGSSLLRVRRCRWPGMELAEAIGFVDVV